MDINTTFSINLNNLARMTNDNIIQATQQLSTGYRINQASDDSSGLEISERLTSQINGDQTSSSEIDQGTSLIDTADSGLNSLQNLLINTRDLLIQYENGTNSDADKQIIQDQVNQNLDTIDNLVNTTYYNGIKVLNSQQLNANGILSNNFTSSDTSVATVNQLFSNTDWQHTVTVDQLASGMEVSGDVSASATNPLGLTGTFTINGNSFSVNSTMSLTDVSNLINSRNIGVQASIDQNNSLVLNSTLTGQASAFTATDTSANGNTFASSSPTTVQTNTLIDNTDWSHNVSVTQLAQAMDVSGNSVTNATTALGVSGNFELANTQFSVTDNMSLTDIANMVNNANLSVSATIINNQLNFISKTTGSSSVFTAQDLSTASDNTTSSNTNVATIGSLLNPTDWQYTLNVNQLATKQITSSDSVSDVNTALNLTGSFKIDSSVFNVNESMSLTDIQNMINNASIGITATIDSNQKLVLTSNSTGASQAFTANDTTNDGNTYSSSNTAVATTNTLLSNTNWQHTVDVSQLAGTMQIDSSSITDVNQSLGYTGTFEINSNSFSITNTMSLTDIQNLINNQGIGVTASIDSNNKLHLTSNVEGAAGTFTVQDVTTDSSSNTFSSSDPTVATTDTLLSNTNWQHTVGVNQLAETMQVDGSSISDINQSLGYTGSFKINNSTFSVTSSMSLNDIKNLINNQNMGVTASIDTNNKLNLTSNVEGSAGTFTLSDISGNVSTNVFSSSNPSIATTDTLLSNTNWQHTIDISQLAGTMQIDGSSITNTNQALGYNGTFKINNTSFSVTSSMSLNDIVNLVNNQGIGVTASIDSNNKLNLTSNTQGAAGVFTVSDLTSDSSSNTFSSSDPTIATTDTLLSNTNWQHTVDISQLAGTMQIDSSSITNTNQALGYTGSFKINNTSFSVTSTMSLNDIVNLVNNQNIGVTASIDSNNKLNLTSNTQGAAGAFTVSDLTSDSSSNTFSSSDPTIATTDTLLSNTNWQHTVDISQLAGTMQIDSSSITNTNQALGYTGTFKINNTSFSVTSSMSLNDIVNLVNNQGIGVTASIDSNNKLNFTSNTQGAAGVFTVSDLTSDSSSNTFSSSDPTIVTTDTLLSNTNWQHTVDVSQLASTMQINGSSITNTTQALGYTGQFKINNTSFSVTSTMSLNDIVNLINNQGIGVTASIDSNNKLNLTSNTQGATGAFTVSDLTSDSSSGSGSSSSSNTNVAILDSVLNNTNWTDNVSVSQLATTSVQDGNDMSTTTRPSTTSWTKDTTSNTNAIYYSDNNGSTYVQVGTSGEIEYSTDGINWTNATSGTTNGLNGVRWLGNQFVATGNTGTLLTSTDGKTWTNHSIAGATDNIENIAYNGSQYVIVSDNGTIRTSTDLTNWTTQNSGTTTVLNNIIWTGSEFVVTGDSGTILTSTNGSSWVKQTTGTTQNLTGITTSGSKIVAVGGAGTVVTSTNGTSWTASTIGGHGVLPDLWDVKYISGQYVAVGSSGNVKTSSDGSTWADASITSGPTLYSVSSMNNQWVAAGSSGSTYRSDGTTDLFANHTTNLSSGGITITNSGTPSKTFSVSFASAGITSTTTLSAGITALVNAINSSSSNYGVTAKQVTETNGTTEIELTSNATGASSNFTVTGDTKFLTDSGLNSSSLYTGGVDAKYSVNGTQNTSASNTNVTIGNGTTNDAIIDLKGIGSTTIQNSVGGTSTNAVMKDIGILNSSGSIANYVQQGQDASYTVDGTAFTSSTNQGITIGNGTTNQATIDLKALGSAIIQNVVQTTNAILKDIGMLNSNGTIANYVQQGQDASYTVDGTAYTSSTNQGVTIGDGTTNQATIDLKAIGSTIIKNVIQTTNAILKDIGMLNSNGTIANYVQQGQDAAYTVDGTAYTSSTNQGVTIGNGTTNQATIDLKALGSAIIQNVVQNTNAILKDIGILNSDDTTIANYVQHGQDASYTVDGTAFTSSTNQGVTIGDGTTNQATIDLKAIGSTIISNTLQSSDTVLQDIGILNPDGSIANYVQHGQDASYTVDGTAFTSSTNQGVTIGNGTTNQATIDLKALGSTIIQNVVQTTNAILKDIGILTSNNTIANYIEHGQDAAYSIDGVNYTNNTNNGILLSETNGTSDGTIDLKGLGTTIVKNQSTNAILKDIGMLNSTDTAFKNLIQAAANALYNVDGVNYSSSTNTNVTLKSSTGKSFVVVDLTGIGSTILANAHTNAVLADIGILTNTGSFKTIVKKGQDAIYSVDGTQYTSSNNNITLKDPSGTDEATVTLKNLGSAVVYNHKTYEVLLALGILDSSGNFKNILSNAQNANYTIDGVTHSSSTNNNVSLNGDASINFQGLGTTIVSNSVTMDPNAPAYVAADIHLHTGWGYDNIKNFQLSYLNVQNLGLSNLRNSLSNGIQSLDAALDIVSSERGRYGALKNTLQYDKRNLDLSSINLQNARMRIKDTDFAKETSVLLKNQTMLSIINQMAKISYAQQSNILKLLNG